MFWRYKLRFGRGLKNLGAPYLDISTQSGSLLVTEAGDYIVTEN